MATFVVLRQPFTILVTDFTKSKILTNDLLISNSLIFNKSLVKQMMQLDKKSLMFL